VKRLFMPLPTFLDPVREALLRLLALASFGLVAVLGGWLLAWRRPRAPRPTRARSLRRLFPRLRNPAEALRWFLLVRVLGTYALGAGVLGSTGRAFGAAFGTGGTFRCFLHADRFLLVLLPCWAWTLAGDPGRGQFPRRWVAGTAATTVLSGVAFLAWPAASAEWLEPARNGKSILGPMPGGAMAALAETKQAEYAADLEKWKRIAAEGEDGFKTQRIWCGIRCDEVAEMTPRDWYLAHLRRLDTAPDGEAEYENTLRIIGGLQVHEVDVAGDRALVAGDTLDLAGTLLAVLAREDGEWRLEDSVFGDGLFHTLERMVACYLPKAALDPGRVTGVLRIGPEALTPEEHDGITRLVLRLGRPGDLPVVVDLSPEVPFQVTVNVLDVPAADVRRREVEGHGPAVTEVERQPARHRARLRGPAARLDDLRLPCESAAREVIVERRPRPAVSVGGNAGGLRVPPRRAARCPGPRMEEEPCRTPPLHQ
jgi:hypothetical protein